MTSLLTIEEVPVTKKWKRKKASTRAMIPTLTMSEPVMMEKGMQTDPEKKEIDMQTELVDAKKVGTKDTEMQCDQVFGGGP